VGGRTAQADHRLTLWACSALHLVNDAFFAVFFPLLPLLAADLSLSYAEAGLLKTAFSGASSVFQVPVGLLAERWGEYALLVAGNAWVAAGLIGMGLATAYLPLLGLTVLSGLGGNTQHPLAAALVSRSAPIERRATAVGTLNFAGDLGKMAGPPLVALVALPFGWRAALIGLGLFGLVFSLLIAFVPAGRQAEPRPRPSEPEPGKLAVRAVETRGWGITQPTRFTLLSALGIVDSATRGGALAFLPFLLAARGFDAAQTSWMFTLVFIGGAAGKFACGWLGDRIGATALIVTTELVTVAALALFPVAPLPTLPLLGLAFGVVLNGTSSVLYAKVAEFVSEERRSRGYGLYYTFINGASALAPVLYGLIGDNFGLLAIFSAMAAVNLLTVPLGLALGKQTR
jgi:MFS family permease